MLITINVLTNKFTFSCCSFLKSTRLLVKPFSLKYSTANSLFYRLSCAKTLWLYLQESKDKLSH